jgi:nucleoside diphosphate kinase homolog 5
VCFVQLIEMEGFTILDRRQLLLTKEHACDFYKEHEGKPFFSELTSFMSSGPIWALLLSREDAIRKWQELMGPTNTQAAQAEAPTSLRALYGTGTNQW